MFSAISSTDLLATRALLKMVILYQDLSAGIRARELAERLAKQLNCEAGLHVALWKFDALEYPGMQNLAAEDAAEADMLIVSTATNSMLPASVRDWLENAWPSGRKTHIHRALVALLHQEEIRKVTWDSQDDVRNYLEKIASAQGVDFFCKYDESTPEAPSIAHAQDLLADIPAFLDESFTPNAGWRRWGIND